MNGWGEGQEPEDGGSVQKNEWGQEFEECHFILVLGQRSNQQVLSTYITKRVKMVQRVDTWQLSSCSSTHIKRLNFGL